MWQQVDAGVFRVLCLIVRQKEAAKQMLKRRLVLDSHACFPRVAGLLESRNVQKPSSNPSCCSIF